MLVQERTGGIPVGHGTFRTEFQAIYGVDTGRVVAVEALSRFAADGWGSPSDRFAAAHAAGRGVELELDTLHGALEAVGALPAGVTLSVNLSPTALLDPRTWGLLDERQVADVTVEITEQATLTGYPELLDQRERLRGMGVRVAIDDVGVNVTSMRHLEWLRPDQVKLDLSLTRGLETSARARILARYLVGRARRQGASVVAEGIESPGQLAAWQRLGVDAVQGFLLACPMTLEDALGAAPLTPTVLCGALAS
jgi:EAL domain-containing protein (putative c-di-GMP-specific phosphodiesterase class I)